MPVAPLSTPAPPQRHRPEVHGHGRVVPLHSLPTIAHGGLAEQRTASAGRQTPAVTLDGSRVWVDAGAVWADARHPEPRQLIAVGVASADTHDAAVLGGLCHRLGHEAMLAREQVELPPAPIAGAGQQLTLLDGRLGHEVPTVVAVGPGKVRWGAGGTWESARGRALFGSGWPARDGELDQMVEQLAMAGVGVALAEIGTSKLAALGVHRVAVQLTHRDTAGR
jgi:hypothetical protein